MILDSQTSVLRGAPSVQTFFFFWCLTCSARHSAHLLACFVGSTESLSSVVFETESHIVQVDIELFLLMKMTLNFLSSSLFSVGENATYGTQGFLLAG